MILFFFPHQLFDNIVVTANSYDALYCIEEIPRWKTHQLKCAYARASARLFCDQLSRNAKYVDCLDVETFLEKIISANAEVCMYDPWDYDILDKYRKLFGVRLHIFEEDPLFIADRNALREYWSKYGGPTKRGYVHAHFFKFLKDKMNVLRSIPSHDSENRNALPKRMQVRDTIVRYDTNPRIAKYYRESEEYVKNHPILKKHYGIVDELKHLPISKRDAKRHFNVFLKERLKDFGKYQDAISHQNVFLFHANISMVLNNGLLNPKHVLKRVMEAKGGIPMASKEGFVRQLLGWREYMRFIYLYYGRALKKKVFSGSAKLDVKWYKGTTGFVPFDREVDKVSRFAYAHHIVRLMVFLNLMKLQNVKPAAIHKWFMEMVAIDAYDWVMVSNIAAMGHYGSVKFMRRPYISSAVYILKMSDYKCKNGDRWCEKWTQLYHAFKEK